MTPSTQQEVRIRQILSAALRGQDAGWPAEWAGNAECAAFVEQAIYHGVAGLLVEQGGHLARWPQAVLAPLRSQAMAASMWEMRHRLVVAAFLTALGREGIAAFVLKGTALAYDLYDQPASRARGDSDILVEKVDLEPTRAILRNQGFRKYLEIQDPAHEMDLQEMWQFSCDDGTEHFIDLHWQTMSFPALEGILSFADCLVQARSIDKLCPAALTMSRPNLLLHACAHRGKHLTVPYFSGGTTYYGGDRLIWAKDIDLLCAALCEAEWAEFCDSAARYGLSAVCLDGLQLARHSLATPIPGDVLDRLAAAPAGSGAARFLLSSGKVARAWADLRAVRGWQQKLSYAAARIFPARTTLTNRYPAMKHQPTGVLHVRRWLEFIWPR